MAPADRARLLSHLLAERRRFLAFVAARLGSSSEAEDVIQDAFIRAMQRTENLRDEQRLIPWFFQLLRNVLIDRARARGAAVRRETAWSELAGEEDPDLQRSLCQCLAGVLHAMEPRTAELLRRTELQGEPVATVATSLGLTPNHASVLLHRGRKELRARLEALCGDCTATACLDCDCGETD